MSEQLLVRENGSLVAKDREAVHRDGTSHYCVHWLAFNRQGIYLQRRAPDRRRNPDAWTSTVSGHIAASDVGPKSRAGYPDPALDVAIAALRREVSEELGVDWPDLSPEYLGLVQTDSFGSGETCRCSAYVFRTEADIPRNARSDEVVEVRLFTYADILEAIHTGAGLLGADSSRHVLADNFRPVFQCFKDALASQALV